VTTLIASEATILNTISATLPPWWCCDCFNWHENSRKATWSKNTK